MRQTVREHGLGLLAIVIVAGGVYLNALRTPFVWDDHWLIENNTGIRDLRNVPAFFAPSYYQSYFVEHFRDFAGRGYRPVAEISFAIDHAIWGLNSFGFHLTNVLLHIANCVLAYCLTYRIFGQKRVAVFSALLFAVHPLHTEAIVWAKVRSQLLAFSFVLASVLLYARHLDPGRRQGRAGLYLGSLLLFGLGILCKATAILVPAILVLYVSCFLPRRRWRGALLGVLPFVGAVMVYFALDPFTPGLPRGSVPPLTYLLAIDVALGEYLRLFVAPVGLCLHRSWHTAVGEWHRQAITTLPLVLAFVGGAILALRRSRPAFFALGWFFIGLAPAFRLAFMGRQIAESRVYGPSLGLCMIFGLLLYKLPDLSPAWFTPQTRTRIAVALCLLVLIVCSGLTIVRNADWADPFGLWLDTAEKNPSSWHAQSRVARWYAERRRYDEAIEHLTAASEARPLDTETLRELALLYDEMGNDDEAIAHYRKLLDLDGANVIARVRLGVLFARRGEDDKALGCLREAIGRDPRSFEAHYNLAVFHANHQEYDKAIAEFQLAADLLPADVSVQQDLAAAYAAAGLIDQAAAAYRRSAELDPTSATAWLALGGCYEQLGRVPEAVSAYQRCLPFGGPLAEAATARLADLDPRLPE
jgi:tetratricopeptide (TPR) repeat protein